jgi:solute carrier family 25 S-adenosylmethionine transporter 26
MFYTRLISFKAGAFAAFSVDILVYPLDTLKTRFQSPDYKKIYYNASQTAINKPVFFRGLYQGVGGVILVTLPSCKSLGWFILYPSM